MIVTLLSIALHHAVAGWAEPSRLQEPQGQTEQRGREEAREPRRSQPRPPPECSVVHLKHAQADEVYSVVRSAGLPVNVTPDSRTNSLIVTAQSEDLSRALDLIGKLDIPVEVGAGDVQWFAVRNRSVNDVARQLTQLSSGTRVPFSVAADEARSTILVRGSSSFVDSARKVIEALDTPPNTVQLEFVFLSAGSAAAEGPALPEDLSAVAKELGRFGKVILLGRLMTAALEHDKFKVSGMIANDINAQIRGQVEQAAADGSIRLAIYAGMTMIRMSDDDQKPGRTQSLSFELETTIATRRGDTVVLGTAPAGWSRGDSAILVVRALPAE